MPRKFLLLFCFYIYGYNAIAQHYSFKSYSLESGLPQSEVVDILQDRRGAIWVATNGGGACRFNGLKFQVFDQSQGLINNNIKRLFEDSQGHLWFITERGACRYDGQKMKHFTEKEGFSNGFYFQIFEDRQGRIWVFVEKESGVSKILYFQNDQFVDFSVKYLQLLHENSIKGILLLQSQNLLIETAKGLYEFDGNRLFPSLLLPPSITEQYNTVKPILQDSQKRLWFIAKSKANEREEELLILQNNKLEKLTLPPSSLGNPIVHLFEDRQKNIWISFETWGLIRYDGNTMRTLRKSNGLPGDYVNMLFQDRENNLWIGSGGQGLVRYVGDAFVTFQESDGLESDYVWAIFQDSQARFWLGTSGDGQKGGLSMYDGEQIYPMAQKNAPNLRRVKQILELDKGKLMIASYNGIWLFDGERYENIDRRFELPPDTQVSHILQTGPNTFWIATLGQGAIFYDEGKVSHFTMQNTNIVSNMVRYVIQDSKKQVWFCTHYGLSLWNGQEMKSYGIKDGLISDYVIQGVLDAQERLWMATLGGLVCFDGNTFKNYTTNEGISANAIYSILKDQKEQIWLGTQNGLDRIQTNAQGAITNIKYYDLNEGFLGIENNAGGIYQDRQGNIWLGTVRGAIRYNPAEELKNQEQPQVNLTNIRLFFKNVDWNKEPYKSYHQGILPWAKVPPTLTLPYTLNYLSFEFEVLQYLIPEATRYQWIMQGLDKDWSPVSEKTEAVYTNIPPGKYVFKVRAINSDGIVSETATEYSVEILPPFWESTLFRILLAVALALLITLFVRIRLANSQRQRKTLEEAVKKAQKELLVQNNELKRQQEEIEKQRQNLEELNTTKDRFFSILAHDIKGPLNSLTAFLDIMSKHIDEMSKEDIEFMSASLNKSVKNLYALLENVLSWSRSQMGVLEYNFTHVPLKELVMNNFQLLEVSAQNKGIELLCEVPDEASVFADSNTLNTVLRNLISNAIKFTGVDGKVIIRARPRGTMMEIDISDTGVGMPPEVQERIFRLDKRISMKGTANETGTGLGLILSKEFVEKNKGTISVWSEEGKGTTFTLLLPTLPEML